MITTLWRLALIATYLIGLFILFFGVRSDSGWLIALGIVLLCLPAVLRISADVLGALRRSRRCGDHHE